MKKYEKPQAEIVCIVSENIMTLSVNENLLNWDKFKEFEISLFY